MIRLVLAFLCFPGVVLAELAKIQTGDHADFARVAINIPVGAVWSVGRVANGYGVVVEGIDGFALSEAYTLIGRDRISDMATGEDPNQLDLEIGCDCHVEAFLWQPNWLVVDVKDGFPDIDSPYESLLVPNEIADTVPVTDNVANASLSLQMVKKESASNGPSHADMTQPVAVADAPAAPSAASQAQISVLEREVLESLTRAADQGLLEIVMPPATIREQDAPAIIPDTIPELIVLPEPPEIAPMPDPDTPGLRVETGIDIARDSLSNRTDTVLGPSNCIDDALVDLSSWGDDSPFGTQISKFRAGVVGEFDRTDPAMVEGLAKTYLYFGFGREAIQALGIDDVNSQARAVLIALAQIMDGDTITAPALQAQATCPGAVAFWALMAADEPGSLGQIDTDSIARVFKTLPNAMQVHLGPKFATQMQMLGQSDIAETSLEPALSLSFPTQDAVLAASELARGRGDTGEATAALGALSQNALWQSPEGMIQIVDLKVAANLPVTDDDIAALDALRFEHRDSPFATDIAITQIEALRYRHDFMQALELLSASVDHLDDTQTSTLHDSVLFDAATNSDDSLFLELAFEDTSFFVGPETQVLFAQRLIDMGFAGRAAAFLVDPGTGQDMAERRYLRAAIAVESGDTELAAATLAGMDTRRADQILNGSSAPAGSDSTSEEERAELKAWRSGDWQRLERADDPVLQDVSNLLESQPPSAISQDITLQGSRDLLAQSESLRTTLDGLLQRFPTPQGTPVN